MTQWQRLNMLYLLRGKQRPLNRSAREKILHLLEEEREQEAVQTYRSETRAPLIEAIDAVRTLRLETQE